MSSPAEHRASFKMPRAPRPCRGAGPRTAGSRGRGRPSSPIDGPSAGDCARGCGPDPAPRDASLMAAADTVVSLRVDVDTRRGLDEGVPRLLELFRRFSIRASFFVAMGPDHSGRAIRRALRPSFLAKMWRTNPLKLYGLRTLLSGTLVPARLVGAGAPALLRQIAGEGHEVAPHGWDHVTWQDRIHRLDPAAIRAHLDLAARAFEAAVGAAPA